MGKSENHQDKVEIYEEDLNKEPGPAIGKVVKRYRIEKRRAIRKKGMWTQADLAERAKLTEKHIQKLESGKTKEPFFSTVAGIINALGLDYEKFQDEVREEKAKYLAKKHKR